MGNFLTLENRRNGEILRMHRRRDAEGRIVLYIDGTLPPKSGRPAFCMHVREREGGHCESGDSRRSSRRGKIVVPTGGTVVLPAGVRHHWWNAGDDLLEFSGHAVPAVDLIASSRHCLPFSTPAQRPPPIFYLAHVLWRHRDTQVLAVPPPAVQRILSPSFFCRAHLG